MSGGGLAAKLARRIAAEGPLTVAAFMAAALWDPQDGYYARHQPIGAAGDFTTAPEISQIFGELVGVWCALGWVALGRPEPVILAELGPGRGTLAEDLLRAVGRAMPEFRRALQLHLIEPSPRLRAEQARRLAEARPVWFDRAEDLPSGPLLLIGNEVLDALPIRQFIRVEGGWAERMVALDEGGRLVFARGPRSPAAALMVPETLRDITSLGTVVEICPAALSIAAWLGTRFAQQPGAALLIDYGPFPAAPGPSLRAVRRHRPAHVLCRPGEADLSADVDFAAFAAAARAAGADVYGPVAQARLLTALGGGQRLDRLCTAAAPAARQALESGFARLVDPAQMGERFKALAVVSPGLAEPAGFSSTMAAG